MGGLHLPSIITSFYLLYFLSNILEFITFSKSSILSKSSIACVMHSLVSSLTNESGGFDKDYLDFLLFLYLGEQLFLKIYKSKLLVHNVAHLLSQHEC